MAQAYRPHEYLDESVKIRRFRKKGNIDDTGEDDLSGRRDASPEQIINGLNAVVKGLRAEFFAREVERANAILTPTQSELVEAIRERGMAIHAGSNKRGFYDHFVLAGYVGSNRRLEKLCVVFSAASDNRKSQWKSHNVLDGLELPSLDKSTRFSVTSATDEDPNEDRISGFALVGRIGLAQRGGRHIPLELREANREGMMRGQVSDIPSALFRRFLIERIGATEFENRAPILLATSIPTVV